MKRGLQKMSRNFLFMDNDSGEFFLCQAESIEEAYFILVENGFELDELEYVDELDDEAADECGLDTF